MLSYHASLRYTEELFHARTSGFINNLDDLLHTYDVVRKGGIGFLKASEEVTPQEWYIYEQGMEILTNFPGIQSFALSRVIKNPDKAEYIRKMHQAGFNDFKIYPNSNLPVSVVAEAVAPLDSDNRRVLGYDMWSEPRRREALQYAIDSGSPAISAKVNLIEDSYKGIERPGLLIWSPVYDNLTANSIEARRKAIEGFVYSTIHPDKFLSQMHDHNQHIRVRIYDDTKAYLANLLFDSHPKAESNNSERRISPPLSTASPYQIYNRTWLIDFESLPGFGKGKVIKNALLSLGIGLLLSSFASLLVWMLLSSRELANVIANQITRQLKESEERYELAVTGASAGLWEWDVQNDTIVWGGVAWKIFGEEDNKDLPDNMTSFLDKIHPGDKMRVQAEIEQHIKLRKPYISQYRVKIKDDGYIWVRLMAQIMLREEKERFFMAGSLIDITDQKAAEEKLAFSQKMDAIGKLTGGIAHDFNNLLQVILGNIHSLQKQLNKDDAILRKVNLIEQAAKRGASLTQRMLAFSREQELSEEELDVNATLTDLKELLERSLGEKITVTFRLHEGLPKTLLDKVQLESSLLNLAVNARDAMPEGGKLTIETDLQHVDESFVALSKEERRQEGEYIILTISDTGQGINQEDLSKIFDPFFTTKLPGKGTGLGLSLVFGFIRQSGGFIKVYSEEGFGTTFRIFLPVRSIDRYLEEKQEASERAKQVSASGLKGKILIVEDDQLVRETVEEHLREAGHKLVTVATAEEAIDALKRESFDLLFSDVVLSGKINGPSLVVKARQLYPAMKYLLTSGYAEHILSPEIEKLLGDVHILSKPYKIESLLLEIEKMLKER